MLCSHKAPTRAFQFREQFQSIREENSDTIYFPDISSFNIVEECPVKMPFKSIDFSIEDKDSLLSECVIDQSIFPVQDTKGGSTNAQNRWNAFKDQGLKHYHKKRNNPLSNGVSRLSAYFHYGMISIFQVAKEAQNFGDGGKKYLDELLIWRELAYHWCFHKHRPQDWKSLPNWAKHTLEKHTVDQRATTYSWQELRYAKTTDQLWNACQQSLNRHGELHNNLRMSWGKQLILWHKSPQRALRITIDLNNRFALDGRDPASYGGILWCFGLFDRPFNPEKAIWGSVRERTTNSHANRLDINRYETLVNRTQYHRMTIEYRGPIFTGLLLKRFLEPYNIPVLLNTVSTELIFPTKMTKGSTRSKLEILSWQDAGWVLIQEENLTWTECGYRFFKQLVQTSENDSSALNQQHQICVRDIDEMNATKVVDSVHSCCTKVLMNSIQESDLEQLTLF